MKLRAWMKAAGWSQQALAAELGVSQAHVSRVVSGVRTPSDKLKVRIAEISGGEVRPVDWFPTQSQAA